MGSFSISPYDARSYMWNGHGATRFNNQQGSWGITRITIKVEYILWLLHYAARDVTCYSIKHRTVKLCSTSRKVHWTAVSTEEKTDTRIPHITLNAVKFYVGLCGINWKKNVHAGSCMEVPRSIVCTPAPLAALFQLCVRELLVDENEVF